MREQVNSLQNATVTDQNRITELQHVISTLQSENAAISAQLDVKRLMATDAETRQQSMLKALSAEFATVVREAQPEAEKNLSRTSSS